MESSRFKTRVRYAAGAAPARQNGGPAASHGPSDLLPPTPFAAPEIGEKAGGLRVTYSTPDALELRASSALATLALVGGALLGAVLLFALGLSLYSLIRPGEGSNDSHGLLIFWPLAVGFLWMGASRLGLRYRIDRRDRSIHCHRMFRKERVWEAKEINHVRLIIVPPDGGIGERLVAAFVRHDGRALNGKDILTGELCEWVATRLPKAVVMVRVAVTAAGILGVPVRVQGAVRTGTQALAAVLTGGQPAPQK